MKFNNQITIGHKVINENSPTFIIGEAGVNHGGDINLAKKLIDLAADAGVDAVKFQTFKADNLILKNIDKAPYQKKTTESSESQYEMLKKLEVSNEENILLKKYSESKGLIFLTTPFDEESLDSLDNLDIDAYKIASTDTTNLPFLEKVAKKSKPIILSTGMSYLSEVKKALAVIHKFNKDLVLLQCTANYPIDDKEANIAVLNTFKREFDVLLGYSDHSEGTGAAPYSIPLGAKIIEKHFTLDKEMSGPDHRASLSPNELFSLVKIIRKVDQYIGTKEKIPTDSELATRKSLQKCLVAKDKISKDDVFSLENIVAKRTGGNGISPIEYYKLAGKKASKDYAKDEIIIEVI